MTLSLISNIVVNRCHGNIKANLRLLLITRRERIATSSERHKIFSTRIRSLFRRSQNVGTVPETLCNVAQCLQCFEKKDKNVHI